MAGAGSPDWQTPTPILENDISDPTPAEAWTEHHWQFDNLADESGVISFDLHMSTAIGEDWSDLQAELYVGGGPTFDLGFDPIAQRQRVAVYLDAGSSATVAAQGSLGTDGDLNLVLRSGPFIAASLFPWEVQSATRILSPGAFEEGLTWSLPAGDELFLGDMFVGSPEPYGVVGTSGAFYGEQEFSYFLNAPSRSGAETTQLRKGLWDLAHFGNNPATDDASQPPSWNGAGLAPDMSEDSIGRPMNGGGADVYWTRVLDDDTTGSATTGRHYCRIKGATWGISPSNARLHLRDRLESPSAPTNHVLIDGDGIIDRIDVRLDVASTSVGPAAWRLEVGSDVAGQWGPRHNGAQYTWRTEHVIPSLSAPLWDDAAEAVSDWTSVPADFLQAAELLETTNAWSGGGLVLYALPGAMFTENPVDDGETSFALQAPQVRLVGGKEYAHVDVGAVDWATPGGISGRLVSTRRRFT